MPFDWIWKMYHGWFSGSFDFVEKRNVPPRIQFGIRTCLTLRTIARRFGSTPWYLLQASLTALRITWTAP